MWKATRAYLSTIDTVTGKATDIFIRNISAAPLEEHVPNSLARIEIKLRVVDGKVDTTYTISHKLIEGSLCLTDTYFEMHDRYSSACLW